MKARLYYYLIEKKHLVCFIKRIIYIVCFLICTYIDQIVGSATGYIQNGYRNYSAVIIAIIILSSYKIVEFKKIRYMIWCLLYIFLAFLSYEVLLENTSNHITVFANLWFVFFVGLILFQQKKSFILKKNSSRINGICYNIFFIMTFLMVLIRSDCIWTITFLSISLLLYLTDFKEEDLNNLFAGMLDGIIIGFFVIQIQAWKFRPYDILRYHGMYAHPNMNALFYLCVFCALLCKWYMLKLKNKNILLQIPYIIMSGFVISTMFYTGSRTAFITFIIIFIIFLFFQLIWIQKWKILKTLISALLLSVSIVVCILPTYWLIRYVPAYFNDPLYFESDIPQIDKKVQKNDDIYSDKYIELGRAADVMFERYLWFLDDETAEYIEGFIRDFPESINISLKVDAATLDTVNVGYVEPGSDKEHPLELSGEFGEGSYDVRIDIYKYFWNKVELIGNKNNPIGVWTSKTNYAGHCHNLFLQIAYDFGIIVGVIFILLIVMIYIRIIIGLVKERSPDNYFRLFVATMYITLFVVFGMFEIDWRYGQLSFTMFFVVQYVIHHKMPEPEAVAETAPVEVGQYVVPGKGGFKELVVVDLDAEEE